MAILKLGSRGTEVNNLQNYLKQLGFYVDSLNGEFGPTTQGAVKDFQARYGGLEVDGIVGPYTANAIQKALSTVPPSASSYFSHFKQIEDDMGANADKLAFLDRGIDHPEFPYKQEIAHYPTYLKRKPDGTTLLPQANKSGKFKPYPIPNQLPQIEANGLSFLSPEVAQACVCIGSFDPTSNFIVRWLGRDALNPVQFWSATKFIPVLNLVCQANRAQPSVPVEDCNIKDRDKTTGFPFIDLVTDIISYRNGVDRSNIVAGTFKRFETAPYSNLETWLRRITHNDSLKFQGGYSPNEPLCKEPILLAPNTQQPVVKFQDPGTGDNLLSAYDLVRMISMLGWHNYLAPNLRLPDAQWHSLASVVRCMGTDSARYVDAAIEALKLQNTIRCPVILSKLGFGLTGKGADALTYAAFVQFIDENSRPAKLRTFALALRIPTSTVNAAQHDARMAAEVTEIIRRIVTEVLA